MKKILLFSLLAYSVLRAEPVKIVPFSFDVDQIEQKAVEAQTIINCAYLKKIAVVSTLLAGSTFYIYRTWYKYMEWAPPGTLLVEKVTEAGESTGQLLRVGAPSSTTWFELIGNLARTGSEMGGEFALGYLVRSTFDPLVNRYIGSLDNTWFLNKHTSVNDLRKSICEDIILLPLADKSNLVNQRIDVITQKLELLMSDLMKFYGYLEYRQQLELENNVLCAVKMKNVIEVLKGSTEQFCIDFQKLIDDYKANSEDTELRAQKGAQLESKLVLFFDTLYADIKTFDLYERKRLAKDA